MKSTPGTTVSLTNSNKKRNKSNTPQTLLKKIESGSTSWFIFDSCITLLQKSFQASFKRKLCVLITQSCPILCDPMNCSLPGSSVHGILQARILEWVTISFSRGSSRPRDWTRVSGIGGRRFNLWATREARRISIDNDF